MYLKWSNGSIVKVRRFPSFLLSKILSSKEFRGNDPNHKAASFLFLEKIQELLHRRFQVVAD